MEIMVIPTKKTINCLMISKKASIPKPKHIKHIRLPSFLNGSERLGSGIVILKRSAFFKWAVK